MNTASVLLPTSASPEPRPLPPNTPPSASLPACLPLNPLPPPLPPAPPQPGLSAIVTAVIGARKIFQRMTTYSRYTVAMTFRICFTFGLITVIYDWCVGGVGGWVGGWGELASAAALLGWSPLIRRLARFPSWVDLVAVVVAVLVAVLGGPSCARIDALPSITPPHPSLPGFLHCPAPPQVLPHHPDRDAGGVQRRRDDRAVQGHSHTLPPAQPLEPDLHLPGG